MTSPARSAIEHVIAANADYVDETREALPAPPAQHLAVVTCMDARLDVLPALGLAVGAAHVIRNAGGIVTDDVLRSLAISQHALGTRSVAVLHHTGCGMAGFDDDAFRAELSDKTGAEPPWRVPGFEDAATEARRSLSAVRGCPWLPHRDDVHTFVWDVASGAITEVV